MPVHEVVRNPRTTLSSGFDQVRHHLVIAQYREGNVQGAGNPPVHLVGHPVLQPKNAAEDGLGECPAIGNELLSEHGECLRQTVSFGAVERLLKPIAADILGAQFAENEVVLQSFQCSDAGNVSQAADARARQDSGELSKGQ